jgi:Flp pilus assembly protein TadB
VTISRRWIVLSDHELKSLREVERQCMADDPDFTRTFEAGQARLSRHPHQLGLTLAVVAAALLTTFLLVAGSLGSAVVVATGLIIWAVRHRSASTKRQTP